MPKLRNEPPDRRFENLELLPGTEILTETPWFVESGDDNTKLEIVESPEREESPEGPAQISYIIRERTGDTLGPFMVERSDFLERLRRRGVRHTYLDVEKLPDSEKTRLMVEASKRFAVGKPLTEGSTLAHVLERLENS